MSGILINSNKGISGKMKGGYKSNVKLMSVLLFIVIAIVSISLCLEETQVNTISEKSNGGSSDGDITPTQIDENTGKNLENGTNKENTRQEFDIANISELIKKAKKIDGDYEKIMNSIAENTTKNMTRIEIEENYNKTIKLVRDGIERLNEAIYNQNNINQQLTSDKQSIENTLNKSLNDQEKNIIELENKTQILNNLTNNRLPEAKSEYKNEKDDFMEKCTSIPLILIGLLIGAIIGGFIAYNWKRDIDKWGMYEKIDRTYTLKISFIIIMILIIILLSL